MDNRFITLQTLYNMVKDEPHPDQYVCSTREMILHSTFGWELIHAHLTSLAEEGLVVFKQMDTLHFSLTPEGVAKAATDAAQNPPAELQLISAGLVIANL
ncbi:hypothetical protein [Sediminibacterium ginsengisoli]|uniref:YjcQ protein n=1 Tax=Sediminibacterium ginsengisoli TaxID=413434 RepID=A0A1T4QCJ2_9BACT|nr:hypothetical protein [Sediminibacterium ginsengisoli]SKA01394.1 hypothetical protein SAMN04488132_10845 [Sediminibacterium ginsengisoli]